MYLYTCIYVHVYIYIYIHIYVCNYIYTYTDIHTYRRIHIYVYFIMYIRLHDTYQRRQRVASLSNPGYKCFSSFSLSVSHSSFLSHTQTPTHNHTQRAVSIVRLHAHSTRMPHFLSIALSLPPSLSLTHTNRQTDRQIYMHTHA